MINVGRVINSSKLRKLKPFTVWRKTGDWVAGRFEETEQAISMYGVVNVASSDDIIQVPEGDRTTGLMSFHCTSPLFKTRNGSSKGTSDEIEWNGGRYKILKVLPWSDYGYFKALGTSMEGD